MTRERPLLLHASLWVASRLPDDPQHDLAVATLRTILTHRVPVVAGSFLFLDLAARLAAAGAADLARDAADRLSRFPTLRLHPLADTLVAHAITLAASRRLDPLTALYAALADEADALLLATDAALVERLGALPPAQWLDEFAPH